ncbi:class I SAM-dependent methyltransferase [Mycolicibacterium sp. 3033]|nr:class I SAM-dependent methyltransferase [Mycolicibacterium aurantiacum]
MPETVATPRPVTPTSILAAELSELCERVSGTVGREVLDKLLYARDLAAGLDAYVAGGTTGESPTLAELARVTGTQDWHDGLEQEMLSGHVEGQLLKFLVRMSSAVRVLEIGMFTGYSALAMAEALPDSGTVVACEIDSGAAAVARAAFDRSDAGHRIRIELGPALETLRRLVAAGEEPFDFVFIDADKSGYQAYLDLLLDSSLLAPDAVIAVDNTLMQGQPWTGVHTENGAAIAEFNRALAADPRTEQVLIPVRDGLTLIRPSHR